MKRLLITLSLLLVLVGSAGAQDKRSYVIGFYNLENLFDVYDDLSMAVHNIRMLFDGNVILGGYMGSYIEEYMEDLWKRVDNRNPFGDKAENYLMVCQCKTEASASGAAAYYIERFLDEI